MIKFENEFVDEDTARSLQELGYKWGTDHWYIEVEQGKPGVLMGVNAGYKDGTSTPAPRVSEVRRWFRAVYGWDMQVLMKPVRDGIIHTTLKYGVKPVQTRPYVAVISSIEGRYWDTYERAAIEGVRAMVRMKLRNERMEYDTVRRRLM
jgi:hypothetical protein